MAPSHPRAAVRPFQAHPTGQEHGRYPDRGNMRLPANPAPAFKAHHPAQVSALKDICALETA